MPKPGDVIAGKYAIDSVLGEGGFGIVLRATTINSGRLVAIKALKPGTGGYERRQSERFLREMRAIARLQCPHTLTLYDFGTTESGVMYMVSEYVEGEDLLDVLLRRSTLPESEAIHLLYQVLLSLAEAHEHGVVHRDIKPANIRIFRYGDDELRAKVLDFGLVRSVEGKDARLTSTGKVVGTPRYMAPEAMYDENLTPATDIYSSGLVAFEMIVGRNDPALENLSPIKEVRLQAHHPVSEGFRNIVNRMVAQLVVDRYTSANAVLRDLRKLLEVDTSEKRPVRRLTMRLGSVPVQAPATRRRGKSSAGSPVTGVTGSRFRGGAILALFVGFGVAGLMIALMLADEPDVAPPPRRGPVRSIPQQYVGTEDHDEPVDVGADLPIHRDGCGTEPPFVGLGYLEAQHELALTRHLAYVPKGYDAHKPTPVIFLFKDAGRDDTLLFREAGFQRLAERRGAILIAPNATEVFDVKRLSRRLWHGDNGLAPLHEVWDIALKSLCIDQSRIFAVGHAAGGLGAERMACEYPVRAIATKEYIEPVGESSCEPEAPVPYLKLVAEAGFTKPRGGNDCGGIARIPWAESQTRRRAFNGCEDPQRTVRKDKVSECVTWSCTAPFIWCVVDGGRPWPGTNPPVSDQLRGVCGGVAGKFDHLDAVWEFFSTSPERGSK
jgi:poly(3-hydroxybutyrate) depolymerase